jgi:hypothetical protein
MRYSISYLLLFAYLGLPAMEQPPQGPEQSKKPMSERELLAEDQSRESYLSVLPADIKNLIPKYVFNTLEQQIYLLREKLKESRKSVTPDLIFELAKKFSPSSKEVDPELISKITLLLTDDYSRYEMYKYFDEHKDNIPTIEQIFSWLKDYVNANNLDYLEAIKLIEQQLWRSGTVLGLKEVKYMGYDGEWRINYPRIEQILELSFYFNKRYQLLDGNVLPFVRILVDLGLEDSKLLLRSFISDKAIEYYSGFVKQHSDILHKLYFPEELQKIGSPEQNMQAFKQALCNSITYLLHEAFVKNQTEKINFLIGTIFYVSYPEKPIEECFIQKFKGVLGQRIALYLQTRYIFSSYSSQKLPLTDILVVVLEHALNNRNTSAHDLIKLFEHINFKPSYSDITPNSTEKKLIPRKKRLLEALEKVSHLTNTEKYDLMNIIGLRGLRY